MNLDGFKSEMPITSHSEHCLQLTANNNVVILALYCTPPPPTYHPPQKKSVLCWGPDSLAVCNHNQPTAAGSSCKSCWSWISDLFSLAIVFQFFSGLWPCYHRNVLLLLIFFQILCQYPKIKSWIFSCIREKENLLWSKIYFIFYFFLTSWF